MSEKQQQRQETGGNEGLAFFLSGYARGIHFTFLGTEKDVRACARNKQTNKQTQKKKERKKRNGRSDCLSRVLLA